MTSKKTVTQIVTMVGLVAGLIGFTGCGSMMHPKAGEYLEQAKGPTGVETQLNLITMLETSIKAVRGQANYEAGLDTVHNQLYALKKAGCQVTDAQSKTLAYSKASTLRREVKTVFHRLWKVREDAAQRDLHLELLLVRLGELRDALQSVKI